MRYLEIIKNIDEAFFEYDKNIESIESEYPSQLTTLEYKQRKSRLSNEKDKLEKIIKQLFDELDIEIQKIRHHQPHFDKNLILQKRDIFPKHFVFGRIKISHDLLREKYIPRVLEFPLSTSVYSYDEDEFYFIRQYILRVLQISPLNKIEFLFIDPKKIGKTLNFLRPILDNYFVYNQKILTTQTEIKNGIKELSLYLEYILQKQLSGYRNWLEYNQENPKSLLPLKVLVINGYPEQFDNESLLHLDRIIKYGAEGGINSFIFLNEIDENNETLKNYEQSILTHSKTIKELGDYNFKSLKAEVTLDLIPKKENIKSFLEQINNAYLKTSTIKGEIDAFWRDNFWSKDSIEGVKIPIGWDDNEDIVNFEFGFDYSEHHTLIGGRSGSGKSNLVNIIIQNLAYFYSPKEVELFLLDYKEGVEFNSYTNPILNHTSLIAINSNVTYGITFLEYIIAQKDKRSELFKSVGVKDYKEYRNKVSTPLSRIVIIIDEFQTLFTTKESDKVERMFAEILRKGRSFGIHLILSTQTLSGVDVSSLNQLKSQIGNRIALAMGEDDSRAFLSSMNEEAAKLKGKPEAIYNNLGGNINGNKKIYIPFASRENLEFLLNKVSKEAIRNSNKIYDGDSVPHIPSSFDNKNFEIILGKEQDFLEREFKIKFNSMFGNNLLIFGKNKQQKQDIIDILLTNIKDNFYYINSDIDIKAPKNDSFEIFNKELKDSFIIIDSFDILNDLHPKSSGFGGFGFEEKQESISDKFKHIVEEGYRDNVFTILFVDNYKRMKTKIGEEFFTFFDYRIGYNLNSNDILLLNPTTEFFKVEPIFNHKGIFFDISLSQMKEFKFFKVNQW